MATGTTEQATAKLSLPALTAMVVGSMVGAGVFQLPARFAAVVRAAFGQRRKTLRNALQPLCDADAIAAVGIDPSRRAEQLEVADFIRLANSLPPA